jgi:glutamate dehydrogenase
MATMADITAPLSLDCHRKLPNLIIKTTDFPRTWYQGYTDHFESYFESSGDTITESPVDMSESSSPGGAPQRLVGKLKDDLARHPSPQPTHFSVPYLAKQNGNGHRILRSATVGYVAPEFKGKADQMEQGKI